MSPTSIFNTLFATFIAMALSLPDLPVELIYHTLNFIPSKEYAIISVRGTCRALALKTAEIFAREYPPPGSWPITRRTVSALTGISQNKFLNPALERVTLFRYINKYEHGSKCSLTKGINIKELGQSLQILANLRSLCLADFNCRGSEKFLGDLLATLSLPLITDFELSNILVHARGLRKFIALNSNTIKTVVFDELDLSAPEEGAWSGLLRSLTRLKDVKLIHICRTGSYFLTTILILASSLEPYVSIPRSLPRMSHRMSKYLFPLPNDDVVVILFATYLSPIWCIYRGSRALFNRQSSYTWLSV